MITTIIAKLTSTVEESRTVKDSLSVSATEAAEELGELFDVEKGMNKRVWDGFEAYELCAKKIHKADLEDIARFVSRYSLCRSYRSP